MNTTTQLHTSPAPPRRGIELPAAVAITWALAGGLVLGGVGVALMLFTERMSAHLMLTASTVLFAVGAVMGLAHGLVLGVFGRPESWSPARAGGALLHGLLYLAPALLIGWLLAGWVASLPIAMHGRHFLATAISMLAWVAMLVVLNVAASRGAHAAKLAWARWNDRVLGSALVGTVLVALLASFLIEPPTIWFTSTALTPLGAVLFAGFLTFWFYGPLITLALALARRWRPAAAIAGPAPAAWRRGVASAGIALTAGIALALIAIPFYGGPTGLPAAPANVSLVAALLATAGNAVADELLFRLGVLTIVLVLAIRLLPPTRRTPLGFAIGVAAALDLALHLPGVPALGLPGAMLVTAFIAVRLVIPAVLFGYLYWRRGLGTAVGAHIAADAALILLAA